LADRSLLQDLAAKVSAIANDCFDRPAAERLRQLGAELEELLAGLPVPDQAETDTKPVQ
jgi:hypothetical protein